MREIIQFLHVFWWCLFILLSWDSFMLQSQVNMIDDNFSSYDLTSIVCFFSLRFSLFWWPSSCNTFNYFKNNLNYYIKKALRENLEDCWKTSKALQSEKDKKKWDTKKLEFIIFPAVHSFVWCLIPIPH